MGSGMDSSRPIRLTEDDSALIDNITTLVKAHPALQELVRPEPVKDNYNRRHRLQTMSGYVLRWGSNYNVLGEEEVLCELSINSETITISRNGYGTWLMRLTVKCNDDSPFADKLLNRALALGGLNVSETTVLGRTLTAQQGPNQISHLIQMLVRAQSSI